MPANTAKYIEQLSSLNVPALVGLTISQIVSALGGPRETWPLGGLLAQYNYRFIIGEMIVGIEFRFWHDTGQVQFIFLYSCDRATSYQKLIQIARLNEDDHRYLIEKLFLGSKKDIFGGVYIYDSTIYQQLKEARELR